MGDVVLVGAGHAHLHVVKRARDYLRLGARLTIISPHGFWYSGMATGVLGGGYPPALAHVDVAALAQRTGAACIESRVLGIDRDHRRVQLASGKALTYDLLSLNVGSEVPPTIDIEGGVRAYPVKPIERLVELRRAIEAHERGRLRLVVVGGGASGCEVAANVAALARRRGRDAAVTVISRRERLLPGFPASASRKVHLLLERRGVQVRLGAEVIRVESDSALLADGSREPLDLIVLATGLVPPPLARRAGLLVRPDGGLRVDGSLRAVEDPRILGAGDCIAIEKRDLAMIGVYAVRQAPVLHANLLAALRGQPARRFEPQRRFLLILNLGDGTALATRGRWSAHGRLAFRLKDWLDRRFLKAVQPR
ncbi:MAG: NAD(P)/FAD-dependent oxidoreductase [Longimicrobiales bacterium]